MSIYLERKVRIFLFTSSGSSGGSNISIGISECVSVLC